MELFFYYLAFSSLILWGIIILLPWRPWFTSEQFDVNLSHKSKLSLSDITVLIPARNESQVIQNTLRAVMAQGEGINVILIDDHSTDKTSELATALKYKNLKIINSKPLPQGWGGKMWGLEQGLKEVKTPFTLLLDADVMIVHDLVKQLKEKIENEKLDFVSLMANPPLKSFPEKLLMPAFIYFFKLLYPFRLANSKNKIVAAAAGGCVLTKTEVLEKIGGFEAIKHALIDDCSLARKVKDSGYRTWLGLSHDARTVRPYSGVVEIWDMVARTAYNQLMYSPILLLICTLLLFVVFLVPIISLFFPTLAIYGIIALGLMFISYLPTVLYYRVPFWVLLMLPVTGTMYLMMTWTSAFRYWKGEQVRWRGRIVIKNQEKTI